MEYNYPQLTGICAKAIKENKCLGCNRLELLDFKGLEHCKHLEEFKQIKGEQEKIWT